MSYKLYTTLLVSLALIASLVRGTENINDDDIYEHLFEPEGDSSESEKSRPLSSAKSHELLKRAHTYYHGRTITDAERTKVDQIDSYLEAGEISSDKCKSSEFKKLNLMFITGLYNLDDDEHFGLNDLPNLFYNDFHYTNALDYLKYYRRKQVKECINHLKKSGDEVVNKIKSKLPKDLTDTSKSFVDSLFKITKELIVSSRKSPNGLQEYGEKFKKEVGATCSVISSEIEPLIKLHDLLNSEAKKSETILSASLNDWFDRAETCSSILQRIDEIIEGSYKVYGIDKNSFLGKLMNKCFGKKSCRKSDHQ